MADDSRHKIEIETVAPVERVERESVGVVFYPKEGVVSISQSSAFGDYHYVSWPLAKTRDVTAALQQIADAEGVPAL